MIPTTIICSCVSEGHASRAARLFDLAFARLIVAGLVIDDVDEIVAATFRIIASLPSTACIVHGSTASN